VTDRIDLTPADVAKLLNDPSVQTRRETAGKVARQMGDLLSDAERKLAEDIVRVFLRDAATSVRAALSENLKNNPNVPHDLAVSLARDVSEVSVPMIQFSEVLSDSDLMAIVRESGTEQQVAVASRASVSENVSQALAETGKETVVATLVSNEGAKISEKTLAQVVDNFGDSPNVATGMVRRSRLPIAIAERLVNRVSGHLRDELVARQSLPDAISSDLILQARERATMGLLAPDSERVEVAQLVAQLHENGRLTPSIILRAVCMGDLRFFEAALAKIADIPVENAWKLISDPSGRGLDSLLRKCRIPNGLFRVFRAAVEVAGETKYDGGPNDRERFRARVIERILTTCEDSFDSDNLEYLVAKLSRPTSEAA
jgi:uncharacterized protein (DUF2336 family)